MVLAEIITIGDELLIGQVVDTNSAWLGQRLNQIGVKVKQITSISDDREHILTAISEAKNRADIILITGGLGPTKDDVTKKTLCEYFNSKLIFHQPSFEVISEIFRSRGREITEVNKQQAMVPENCSPLVNLNGTAPGMWFDFENKILVSMPGVPSEMKGLMENEVIPRLVSNLNLPSILHRTLLTQGVGESFLSAMIEEWELALPSFLKLAYLPAAGIVRLRISAYGNNKIALAKEIDLQIHALKKIIGEFVFGEDDESLEKLIGQLLKSKGATLGTVESCTGGYIAHKITSVAGSSEYYRGSIVPYSNDLKISLLKVDQEMITENGAVSKVVVEAMAKNGRTALHSDYCIATSGIAGPTGGSTEKPVGTVWIAIASDKTTISWKVQLGSNRIRIITETALHALNGLRKLLISQ